MLSLGRTMGCRVKGLGHRALGFRAPNGPM